VRQDYAAFHHFSISAFRAAARVQRIFINKYLQAYKLISWQPGPGLSPPTIPWPGYPGPDPGILIDRRCIPFRRPAKSPVNIHIPTSTGGSLEQVQTKHPPMTGWLTGKHWLHSQNKWIRSWGKIEGRRLRLKP